MIQGQSHNKRCSTSAACIQTIDMNSNAVGWCHDWWRNARWDCVCSSIVGPILLSPNLQSGNSKAVSSRPLTLPSPYPMPNPFLSIVTALSPSLILIPTLTVTSVLCPTNRRWKRINYWAQEGNCKLWAAIAFAIITILICSCFSVFSCASSTHCRICSSPIWGVFIAQTSLVSV